jgi:hypothetical protein
MNNIHSIKILNGDGFGVTRDNLEKLRAAFAHLCPGESLLNCEWEQHQALDLDIVLPKFLWWHGEHSGSSLEVLTSEILPRFSGNADILIVYESGDVAGYRLSNHLVTQHDVRIELI